MLDQLWNYVGLLKVNRINQSALALNNLVSHTEGQTQAEGLWESGAEEDTWAKELWSNREVEQTA
jgi:hypothetical protein